MPNPSWNLRHADEVLSSQFDRFFAPQHNPWRHLGALAFWCLALSVLSGVVAYALYDTSVAGAYESGRRLEGGFLYLGRILRGVHRYGSDAFLVLSILHLVREWVRGHAKGVRWFPWVSGVPLLWLLWIAGITGFWLLWDARALYSVTATAEWVQALPGFSDLLIRNFLTPDALTDRFFSLIVFMHIGIPLFLLAGVWIHIQRIANVRLWPPKPLAVGTAVMLVILALYIPARSLAPAAQGGVPATVSLDWFYMAVHPLVEWLSPMAVWWGLFALSALLLALPWLPSRSTKEVPPAYVDLPNCNGCGRCAADCPFGAVVMVPRSDSLNHRQQAAVIADMCASCGICVGACPSSTPFRRIEDIVSGIELPALPIVAMRKRLQEGLSGLTAGSPKVIVFACKQAADWSDLANAHQAVMGLECSGMLPPSFAEYALRLGADGVVITGCRSCDCEFRLGDRWVEERLTGEREPRLRAAAPRDRIEVVWAGHDRRMVEQAIGNLRQRLQPVPLHSDLTQPLN